MGHVLNVNCREVRKARPWTNTGKFWTGEPHKIPHIGWNGLIYGEMTEDWHGTILQQLTPGNEVYFVHSYSAHPVDPQTRLADCIYNGRVISAVIRSGKVYGCQFHPEKSGQVGLRVLKSFLDI